MVQIRSVMKLQNKETLQNEIQKLPIFTQKEIWTIKDGEQDSNNVTIQRNDGWKAITNDNDIYSVVTDKYQLIQFAEVFNLITSKFDKFIGRVYQHRASAVLVVFPEQQVIQLEEVKGKIGLYALNSVDKSTSVFIRFIIKTEKNWFVVPRVKTFRQVHMGEKMETKIDDFTDLMKNVQTEWQQILTHFKKTKVRVKDFDAAAKRCGIVNKPYIELIKNKIKQNEIVNFWDLFVEMTKAASMIQPKSELRAFKLLEKIADEVNRLSFLMKI